MNARICVLAICAVLIAKADKAQSLESDNRNKGNNPKVDKFRKVTLDQYLDEALFLMELIGVTVFCEPKKKVSSKRKKFTITITTTANNTEESNPPEDVYCPQPSSKAIPPLPDMGLPVGQFIYTAMKNLSESGYTFTPEELNRMCTEEWAREQFHTKYPFMKKFIPGETDNKGDGGLAQFLVSPYIFGTDQVLLSKEWHKYQRDYFVSWYLTLG